MSDHLRSRARGRTAHPRSNAGGRAAILSRFAIALFAAAALSIGCEEVDTPPDGGSSGGSCAVTLCPTDTYCDDISGSAECIPLPSCKDNTCEPDEVCVLRQVQCIRAPCPPLPVCEPAPNSSVQCGNTLCGAGLECCNALCGICVKPGMSCIQGC